MTEVPISTGEFAMNQMNQGSTIISTENLPSANSNYRSSQNDKIPLV
jgi:hypothetical protein